MVNLTESIAVTQNFVPPAHIDSVLRFLKYKNDQVSGFSEEIDPYNLFREALKSDYSHLLEAFDENISSFHSKKRKWTEDSQSTGFSFEFFS